MAGTRAVTVYAGSVLFSLLVLALYVLGAARYLTNLEENTCQMTYMFEYPQYVRIALKDDIEERYPRFGLYAYGEGHATEKHRRMKFSGIPVLFVPGNAGSHEQVRSLASVSLRKSIKDRTPFHFDYFTVSLGKDYSAFYGGVLEDETAYVLLCVKKILSLYKGSMDNIVLIGHSMGGIVAKSALLRGALVSSLSNDTAERKSFASILVTLASPHKPIFLPDRTIARFYEELAQLEYRRRRLNETDTSFVSIGGGRRDILVSASQTIDPSADLNLVSSGIPSVWTSTDHLCILWCKQLVLTIVRALFDCVDANARPPKIHSDPKANIRALSYHLTSGIDGKKRRHKYAEKWKFEAGGEWTEDVRRRYTWSGSANGHTNKTMFLMIRFDEASLTSYDSISIDAINLESRDWLFACSAHAIEANSRVCEWGWNITNRTRLLSDPRQHRSRMSVDIDRKDLRGWKISHVVVRIPMEELRDKRSAASSVKIHVDLYNRVERTIRLEDRTISAGATELLSFLPIGGGLWSPNPYSVVTSLQGSLRYYAVLADIRDAVNVEIEVLPDGTRSSDRQSSRFDKNEDESPRAIFELTETSSFDDGQTSSSSSQVRAVVANDKKDGQFAKKQRRFVVYLTKKTNDAVLRMSFGPEYSYRVEIRRAGIVDRVACLVRDKWPTVYPIIVSLCLLGIATRLDSSPRTLTITLGIFILAATIFDFLVETLVALGLLHVVAITACCLIVAFGTVTHNVATRFLARIVSIPSSWFDWLMGGFDRLPILTTFILLSLASVSCGAVAMLLCVPLYFLKLTKMYEDYLEELFMASVRHLIPRFGRAKRKRKRRGTSAIESSSSDNVNGPNDEKSIPAVDVASASTKMSKGLLLNNLLLFVTWSFAAIPAMPSALVWATNFRHETRLSTEDTTMLFSWLVLTSWHSLGYVEIPTIEARPIENNRRIFSANLLRLLAYLIAFTTAIEESAYYQWIVPPLVALAATSLALLLLFPGDPR